MAKVVTECRIVGRFRKDEKKHLVDYNRNWTYWSNVKFEE